MTSTDSHFMLTCRPPTGSWDIKILHTLLSILQPFGKCYATIEDSNHGKKYDHCHIMCDHSTKFITCDKDNFRRKIIALIKMGGIDFGKDNKVALHLSWPKPGETFCQGVGYALKDYIHDMVETDVSWGVHPDNVTFGDREFTREEWIEVTATAVECAKHQKKNGVLSVYKWCETAVDNIFTHSHLSRNHEDYLIRGFLGSPAFTTIKNMMAMQGNFTLTRDDTLCNLLTQMIIRREFLDLQKQSQPSEPTEERSTD